MAWWKIRIRILRCNITYCLARACVCVFLLADGIMNRDLLTQMPVRYSNHADDVYIYIYIHSMYYTPQYYLQLVARLCVFLGGQVVVALTDAAVRYPLQQLLSGILRQVF